MTDKLVDYCTINIITDTPTLKELGSHLLKPVLQLTIPDGPVIYLTCNLAEMIGGAGKGSRLRWEDALRGAAT